MAYCGGASPFGFPGAAPGPQHAFSAQAGRRGALLGRPSAADATREPPFWWELRGSQGRGVVRNDWFDCVLLSMIYTLKPPC